jgi:hypothetical protein
VLAHPVSVVHEVVVRRNAFRPEVDVAPAAIAQRPLVAVLVTAEASGHLRQNGVGSSFGHLHVASHAVTVGGAHVGRVLEAQMLARELRCLPYVGFAVASHAGPLVVGPAVASQAIGTGREMQRSRFSCALDAHVAFLAVDALEHVRAVLEGMRRRRAVKPENPRARCEGHG